MDHKEIAKALGATRTVKVKEEDLVTMFTRSLVQEGYCISFSQARKVQCQIPDEEALEEWKRKQRGRVAQRSEQHSYKVKVEGSNPSTTTE